LQKKSPGGRERRKKYGEGDMRGKTPYVHIGEAQGKVIRSGRGEQGGGANVTKNLIRRRFIRNSLPGEGGKKTKGRRKNGYWEK